MPSNIQVQFDCRRFHSDYILYVNPRLLSSIYKLYCTDFPLLVLCLCVLSRVQIDSLDIHEACLYYLFNKYMSRQDLGNKRHSDPIVICIPVTFNSFPSCLF